ncbi:hypothetical protein TTHERM_000149399 (macronuclear) [Tetrahymena thermophila SB210]|uniref:Uncharacterized protein n=1 Tax=Tetrahymena thermophila (strain SB210) TaxID=312017 RepID=W7X1C3_TETTS|nr:hypothetical protein TTHERM_000149399 [Tetrahymena thermophila SB210]EWS73025.1 hypothetical protein TTHERM_000149399 [Tetrahymena thermophila SB210]|eukprot:XP_012654422.1 hypothetical protein TTHERM_000149399 [Tetrahymena thermophila SB210]
MNFGFQSNKAILHNRNEQANAKPNQNKAKSSSLLSSQVQVAPKIRGSVQSQIKHGQQTKNLHQQSDIEYSKKKEEQVNNILKYFKQIDNHDIFFLTQTKNEGRDMKLLQFQDIRSELSQLNSKNVIQIGLNIDILTSNQLSQSIFSFFNLFQAVSGFYLKSRAKLTLANAEYLSALAKEIVTRTPLLLTLNIYLNWSISLNQSQQTFLDIMFLIENLKNLTAIELCLMKTDISKSQIMRLAQSIMDLPYLLKLNLVVDKHLKLIDLIESYYNAKNQILSILLLKNKLKQQILTNQIILELVTF